MKKLVLVFILGFIGHFGFSQSPLGEGNVQINAGLGLNNWDGTPIYAGIDYGVGPLITIGGQVAFSDNVFGLGGNFNYHFDELLTLPSEWNVYGGLNIGYIQVDNGGSDVDLGAQVGARYFFSPNVGINLELGGGTQVSGGKVGITIVL